MIRPVLAYQVDPVNAILIYIIVLTNTTVVTGFHQENKHFKYRRSRKPVSDQLGIEIERQKNGSLEWTQPRPTVLSLIDVVHIRRFQVDTSD